MLRLFENLFFVFCAMLNLSRPAFKRKLVKGKGKARTRTDIIEDLDPVVVQAMKSPIPEPEVNPKVARWVRYAKLAETRLNEGESEQDNDKYRGNDSRTNEQGGAIENANLDSEKSALTQLDLGPDAPVVVDALVIVDSPSTAGEASTAGKVYDVPKTFLLRETHFQEKHVALKKEYDSLSDDEQPKPVDDDDEPMVDDSFVHDIPTRFDLEMYETEIMSMASEDERNGRIKVAAVATLEELVASFTQKIQELLLSAEARKQEIQELKLRLDTAVATKKTVLAKLHMLT